MNYDSYKQISCVKIMRIVWTLIYMQECRTKRESYNYLEGLTLGRGTLGRQKG